MPSATPTSNLAASTFSEPQTLVSGQLGTTDVALYTVPANMSARLGMGTLCGVGTQNVPTLTAGATATTGGALSSGAKFWKVTAVNVAGESLGSNEVTATVPAMFLATPVNTAFTTASTGGTLTNATYYYRVSATNAAGETLASAETSQVVAAFLATPVNTAFSTATTGGTLTAATYYYRVSATNSAGETLASTETSIVVPATTTTNTVTVNWGTIAGATGYRVYGRTTAGELFIAAVGAVLTYTDTGSVTPTGALPATNTAATTTSTVVVNWGAVTGATGYRVYGRTTGAELFIAAVGAVVTYADTGAVAPAGALPAANTATASFGTQVLSWTAQTGAVSYNVYRGTVTNTENALITNVPALTFTDVGAAGSTPVFPPTASGFSVPVIVSLSIIKAGGSVDATHRIINAYSLTANDTLSLRDYLAGHFLGPGDVISGYASLATSVDLIVTGVVFS